MTVIDHGALSLALRTWWWLVRCSIRSDLPRLLRLALASALLGAAAAGGHSYVLNCALFFVFGGFVVTFVGRDPAQSMTKQHAEELQALFDEATPSTQDRLVDIFEHHFFHFFTEAVSEHLPWNASLRRHLNLQIPEPGKEQEYFERIGWKKGETVEPLPLSHADRLVCVDCGRTQHLVLCEGAPGITFEDAVAGDEDHFGWTTVSPVEWCCPICINCPQCEAGTDHKHELPAEEQEYRPL